MSAVEASAPRSPVAVEAESFRERFDRLRLAIGRVLVGQDGVVENVLVAVIAGGHVLLEGVPGLGKTLLVRTLAQALDLDFKRVQFTPDLMPADIVGTNVVMEDPNRGRFFEFQAGPVFANIVLADEINRATPKTQSALLEAMQERSVTVAGVRHALPDPFFVLATQNPIEMEGTYPLPEAQLDRFFFKSLVPAPSLEELGAIVDRTTGASEATVEPVLGGEDIRAMRRLSREVPVAEHVRDYALRVVLATHPGGERAPVEAQRFVRYGSSPRGAQAIVLAAKIRALLHGRYNVSFEDIDCVALPALRHRLLLNFEGEAEGIAPDTIVQAVLKSVAEASTPHVDA